ncbi:MULTISPECIES: DUF2523 family protein [Acinetobacter]|jgi:Protein of unknown function (DUF2523)|uniref:DUF2523 family protein n=1 Tax=Acinetobacter TaxID=469 RepID=UPI00044B54B9|nr:MULTISPECIES: DUF2523 family protein [Acinetobacter]EXF55652.1 hypothetical protein J502_3252 [Acinetobacter sp. 1294596]MCK4106520.1 DUF2523 domain-containing protein [Acinetobacter radioresistens]MCK4112520.1 DUF2523 domain-containing protein [Acinetobacter radioresistens]MCX0338242.1 DUF2523 domain-containing protein [Acinetobacter radioresistens]MCX0344049.1 DUF2523 domain-containing protein [Acinetobacter radioresistens]
MRNIFAWLTTLFKNLTDSWLGQVLLGAGLGLATVTGLSAFTDYYKRQAIASFGELGPVTGLLGLAGFDKAISIVIGAYLAAVYIKTFAAGLKVVKK